MSLIAIAISFLITAAPKPAAPAKGALASLKDAGKDHLPVINPFAYTYNPFGKRDPFESYLKENTGTERPKSSNPLLNYDLSKFQLMGIVWGMANPRAIVRDGDGHGHIIRRGTRIGRNRGRVMRILKDRVVVAEQFRDPLGKLIVSEFSMKLKNDEDRRK